MGARFRWVNRHLTTRLTPHRVEDPLVQQLARIRAAVGFVLVVAVCANATSTGAVTGGQLLGDTFRGLMLAPVVKGLIAVPCFLGGLAVVASFAAPGHRAAVPWQGLRAQGFLVAVVVGTGVTVGAAMALQDYLSRPGVNLGSMGAVLSVVLVFGLPIALPIVVFGAYRLAFLSVRHAFQSGDVHPFLPAVIGISVSVVTIGEASYSLAGGADGFAQQQSLLVVGGAVVLVGLAVWELGRLRARGVTLRTAPAV